MDDLGDRIAKSKTAPNTNKRRSNTITPSPNTSNKRTGAAARACKTQGIL